LITMDEEKPYICDSCKESIHHSEKTLIEQMFELYNIEDLQRCYSQEKVEEYNRKEKQRQRIEKIKQIFE